MHVMMRRDMEDACARALGAGTGRVDETAGRLHSPAAAKQRAHQKLHLSPSKTAQPGSSRHAPPAHHQ